MILIITINPLLENRFYISKFSSGMDFRDVPLKQTAGGKGFNVSRQLKLLGIGSLNLTFLGHHNGRRFRELVEAEGLTITSVKSASDTREAAVVVENATQKVTTLFSSNSVISEKEVEEFKGKLPKMIQNCEIVLFSGSSPSAVADSIFPYGIELAHQFDKISFVDTYGSHLQTCIDAAPTVLHNNISETEKSLNISLSDEQQITDYLHALYSKGIKQAFLTDGSRDFYVSNFDFISKIKNPVIQPFDETGSGDAFTAGIVYGHYHDEIFNNTVKLASALGACNAQSDTVCQVPQEDAAKTAEQVTITPIGKKLKLIDDTTTIR
jgi:1-phosphofructokinase family hexose kinase